MTISEDELTKHFQKALTDGVTQEDTLIEKIKNRLLYAFYFLTKIPLSKDRKICDERLTVKIPTFMVYQSYKGETASDEFYFKKEIALSFSFNKSKETLQNFIKYRDDMVEKSHWAEVDIKKSGLNYLGEHLVKCYADRSMTRLKGLFMYTVAEGYIVITTIAHINFYDRRRSLIERIISSVVTG